MSASAARILPAAPPVEAAKGRGAIVHLTPFAPGCEHMPIDHPRRTRTLWSGDAARVLRATLTRLKRDPNAVQLVDGPAAGDVDVVAAVETQPKPVPLAVITDGPSLLDLASALSGLRRTGWTPPHVISGAAQ